MFFEYINQIPIVLIIIQVFSGIEQMNNDVCKNVRCRRKPILCGYCEDCSISRKTANDKYAVKLKVKRAADKALRENEAKKTKTPEEERRLVTVPASASSNDEGHVEPTLLTAMVEVGNKDVVVQQLQDQQLLVKVVEVQNLFNKVYETVISTTTKFNDLSRVAQVPVTFFHGQMVDGSGQDVLLSDHYRNSKHTQARKVFDVCQVLSQLSKQIKTKRVKAQEYLKYEVCQQLQDVVTMSDELSRPMMLQLTMGEVMSSEMRSKVPYKLLSPIEFVPSRVRAIQHELAEMESQLMSTQAEYNSFTKDDIDAAHTTPSQLEFKSSTTDKDRDRFSDICSCVFCAPKHGSLIFMDQLQSIETKAEEVFEATVYESTVEFDITSPFKLMALKMSGVDKCAIVQSGRNQTPVTEESKERLAMFTANIDAAGLYGKGVCIDPKLDPMHVPITTWAKFIPVSVDMCFEISYLTGSSRLRVMVNNYEDRFTEDEIGVVLPFNGSIFGGMPFSYMQEATKRMKYRRQYERHHKSGQVVEDDGTSLIISASKSVVHTVEESKEVTQTVIEGNVKTTTKHKIVNKAEMKMEIKKMWKSKQEDFEDLRGHWQMICKLYDQSLAEKRDYEMMRTLPLGSFKSSNQAIRSLQEQSEAIDQERKDVKIAQTHADLAVYRSQLGQYRSQVNGFVNKSLHDLSKHPNLYVDSSTAICVAALRGGSVVGNKLTMCGQNIIDLPRDWKSGTNKMFIESLTSGKSAVFPHIDEITIDDMESDVLAKVEEQENVKKQVREKVRTLMLRQRKIDTQLNHPNNKWILRQEEAAHVKKRK